MLNFFKNYFKKLLRTSVLDRFLTNKSNILDFNLVKNYLNKINNRVYFKINDIKKVEKNINLYFKLSKKNDLEYFSKISLNQLELLINNNISLNIYLKELNYISNLNYPGHFYIKYKLKSLDFDKRSNVQTYVGKWVKNENDLIDYIKETYQFIQSHYDSMSLSELNIRYINLLK